MRWIISTLGFVLLVAWPASAQEGAPVDTTAVLENAEKAALAWLHQIDEGEYRASWDSAGVAFKAAVTPEQWKASLDQARGSIQELTDRTLISATYAADLPNAPAGEYVIHVFSADTDNTSVIETVTMMRDPDGVWRAGGYFVRPN